MTIVADRWEWRVFDASPSATLGVVDTAGLPREASNEIYLLSASSPHNVKVRGGQLDVKRLLERDEYGFELWRPVFKRAFPIDAADLSPVWSAWGIAPPPPGRSSYSLDELLRDVVEPNELLREVRVEKERARLTIGECRAEHALLTVAGARWETLAIEDEDPMRLLRARRLLAGVQLEPTDYPRLLKHVLALRTPVPLSP